jgi:hypothetical protein
MRYALCDLTRPRGPGLIFPIKKAADQGLPRLSKHLQSNYGINKCVQPPLPPWWRKNNSCRMNKTVASLFPFDFFLLEYVTLDYSAGKVKLLFSVHGS